LASALGRVGDGVPWHRILLVTVIVALYGVLDEVHQAYVPGRMSSVGDVMADTAGGFIVAVMAYRFWLPARQVRVG
jgi:VanZ family protein